MSDSDDIQISDDELVPKDLPQKMPEEKVKYLLEALSKHDPDQRNAITEKIAQIKQINPNDNTFTKISEKEYIKLKLKNKREREQMKRMKKETKKIIMDKAEGQHKIDK